mmetsp:Transcript_13524/g.33152  ORF Transcript_13524/g.33152 Transcript_13524/m.33152 type:complete len:123 (-) Transcript_13524:246-614(-)
MSESEPKPTKPQQLDAIDRQILENDRKYMKLKQHRCHPRLKDIMCGVGRGFDVKDSLANYFKCLQSQKGDEPTVPFVYFNPAGTSWDKPCMEKRGSYKYEAANSRRRRQRAHHPVLPPEDEQ